jgi:filamentous hemagglutinin family protein
MKVFSSIFSVLAMFLILTNQLLAAPYGGRVTSGSASIKHTDNIVNINQNSTKATINWQGFSIAKDETVNFNQPSASAMTLNRVIGNEKSLIDGALNANGKVFLLNSNGILFGKDASVKTGGLVASTLDISDKDFNEGRYAFQGQEGGQVVNLGKIAVTDGSYVALLGQKVINEGVIVAKLGTISLNWAKKATLNFNGDSLVHVSLDEGALDTLVETKNALIADGGKVILTTKAANELANSQINTDGLIQARTLGDIKGNVEIYAYGGAANINGKLDASAPDGGDGGFIETSGDKVKIADSAVITTLAPKGQTGTWLIDPAEYTIKTGGNETGQALSNRLNSTNVKIETTNGDIDIYDVIQWNSATTLTLNSSHDININNAININGAGSLALIFGGDYNILTPASFSGTETNKRVNDGYPTAKVDTSDGIYGSVNFNGTGGSLTINGENYTLLRSLSDLKAISSSNQNGRYALVNNLDLSNATYVQTEAIVPELGLGSVFTGLGHVVSNFTLKDAHNLGLFGKAYSADYLQTVIRDVGVINAVINAPGFQEIGALGGHISAFIKNTYSEGGSIIGQSRLGGLIGRFTPQSGNNINNYIISITQSFSSTSVKGSGNGVGGLIGYMSLTVTAGFNPENKFQISNSHASGNIEATANRAYSFGGLVGTFVSGFISDSYATGAIQIPTNFIGYNIGGLTGQFSVNNSVLINSFATGSVTGSNYVGGLIGNLITSNSSGFFKLYNSYATGDVTTIALGNANRENIGGLIGFLNIIGATTIVEIDRVFASGNIEANFSGFYNPTNIGGLIGYSSIGTPHPGKLTISNAYATGEVNVTVSTTQSANVGGLIGWLNGGTLKNSFATGNVKTNGGYVGGLIGFLNPPNATIGDILIESSYATGSVSGHNNVGGLIGYTYAYMIDLNIKNSYATGIVTGNQDFIDQYGNTIGGLFGYIGGYGDKAITIVNSYFNSDNENWYGELTSNFNSEGSTVSNLDIASLNDSDVSGAILSGNDPIEFMRNREIERQAAIDRQDAIDRENERLATIAAQEVIRQNTINVVSKVAETQDSFLSESQGPANFVPATNSLNSAPVNLESSLNNLVSEAVYVLGEVFDANVGGVAFGSQNFSLNRGAEQSTEQNSQQEENDL